MPGPVSRTATVKDPSDYGRLDRDLALVGELDGVADEVEQHLHEAALVAMAYWQIWGSRPSSGRASFRLRATRRL